MYQQEHLPFYAVLSMQVNKSEIYTVNIGESMITQSSKVRDLGVIFDQFFNFHDDITAICRSTHFHIRNIDKIRNILWV